MQQETQRGEFSPWRWGGGVPQSQRHPAQIYLFFIGPRDVSPLLALTLALQRNIYIFCYVPPINAVTVAQPFKLTPDDPCPVFSLQTRQVGFYFLQQASSTCCRTMMPSSCRSLFQPLCVMFLDAVGRSFSVTCNSFPRSLFLLLWRFVSGVRVWARRAARCRAARATGWWSPGASLTCRSPSRTKRVTLW